MFAIGAIASVVPASAGGGRTIACVALPAIAPAPSHGDPHRRIGRRTAPTNCSDELLRRTAAPAASSLAVHRTRRIAALLERSASRPAFARPRDALNSIALRCRSRRPSVAANGRAPSGGRGAPRSSGPESIHTGRRASPNSRSSIHNRAGAAARGGARAEAAAADGPGDHGTAAWRAEAASAGGSRAADSRAATVAIAAARAAAGRLRRCRIRGRRQVRCRRAKACGEIDVDSWLLHGVNRKRRKPKRRRRFDPNALQAGYRYEPCNGCYGAQPWCGLVERTRSIESMLAIVFRFGDAECA